MYRIVGGLNSKEVVLEVASSPGQSQEGLLAEDCSVQVRHDSPRQVRPCPLQHIQDRTWRFLASPRVDNEGCPCIRNTIRPY